MEDPCIKRGTPSPLQSIALRSYPHPEIGLGSALTQL